MQTFLPYEDFKKTAECLDFKRLGKQRVEAFQIHNIVSGKRTTGGWLKHPAVLMWQHNPDALANYCNTMIYEWISRGYNNTMKYLEHDEVFSLPLWLGVEEVHSSHRSNLLRKDSKYYSQFDWFEDDSQEYFWPVKELKITPLVDKI